jgi:hypothetical protein
VWACSKQGWCFLTSFEFFAGLKDKLNLSSGLEFKVHEKGKDHIPHIYWAPRGLGACLVVLESYPYGYSAKNPFTENHMLVPKNSPAWGSFFDLNRTCTVSSSMLQDSRDLWYERFEGKYSSLGEKDDAEMMDQFLDELSIYILSTVGIVSPLGLLVNAGAYHAR